jgi:drug/metabolite transporter (DMT)-like permease
MIILYAGLAAGPMSVVAPVSALASTVVPVGAALAMGERASAAVYAGAVLCLVAIVLASMEGGRGPGTRPPTGPGPGLARFRVAARGLGYGAASGLAFGIFFLFIRNAGTAGVLWPLCLARAAGTVVILAAAAWLGTRPPGPGAGRWVLPAAAGAGIMDASANICYLLAARAGLFGIAVVISSLYPGITVLLARVTLGERMRLLQRAGLVLAAAGVAMVTF